VGCSSTEPDDGDEEEEVGEALRDLAAQRGIVLGTASESSNLSEAEYVGVMVREFASVTPGNEMKMGPLRPTRDAFDFAEADRLVDFAEARGLKVRGHTLVWHQQLPSWLTSVNWNRDQLIDILQEHITTVVTRYRGRLSAWDVINEGVDEDGSLRETIWLKTIGPEYIEMAFRWAREADPDVRLFNYDYSAEGGGAKSEAVYALVRDLADSGVPIDGVGMQMHFTTNWNPGSAAIAANMLALPTSVWRCR
jgi:endo-1,4-beta-xylanase